MTPDERADLAKHGCDGCGEYSRCDAISQDYARLVAALGRVEALADMWDQTVITRGAARNLRAALNGEAEQ